MIFRRRLLEDGLEPGREGVEQAKARRKFGLWGVPYGGNRVEYAAARRNFGFWGVP